MFTTLRIRNFRCHQDLQIADLARINLIAGRNNVGKSTVLEALFVLCGANNPALAASADARRGMDRIEVGVEPPWASLHWRYDTSLAIEIEGHGVDASVQRLTLRTLSGPDQLGAVVASLGNEQKGLELDRQPLIVYAGLELHARGNGPEVTAYTLLRSDGLRSFPEVLPPAPFPAHLIGARARPGHEEDADYFSKLQIAGKDSAVLDGLRLIEPALESLGLQRIAGQTVLHGRLPGLRLMPVPLMGEGMQRLTTLLTRIGLSTNGVVLVDEIENGLHHSVMEAVLKALGRAAAGANVQIFATTHSAECIEAARLAYRDDPAIFRVHRIDRVEGRTQAVTYDVETLGASREMGLEVR